MQIGELSRRTGVSVRMLRYYESERMLKPLRTAAGYRDYGPVDEETVLQIKMLSTVGMTLNIIRDFLPCALSERGQFEPCDELRREVQQHIDRVDTRVADLKASRALLKTILKQLEQVAPSTNSAVPPLDD